MFDIKATPSGKGKIAVVTGANTGLGYENALELARKEYEVVMACRNMEKAETARKKILEQVPDGNLEVMKIDLSKLDSVRSFAENYLKSRSQLDILINNAGVMMPPYSKTEDDFELQMGANYFGHFLLTGLLFDTIVKTPDSRIVSLSSNAHKQGKINFDDLQSEKKYSKLKAYSQSKLACLMYAFELQRRLDRAGHTTLSVAAHPGASDTDLGRHIPKWAYKMLRYTIAPLIIHSSAKGALPTMMAAVGSDTKGGEYFGPTGFMEMKGKPGRAKSTSLANNEEIAAKLWSLSEELTGIQYP